MSTNRLFTDPNNDNDQSPYLVKDPQMNMAPTVKQMCEAYYNHGLARFANLLQIAQVLELFRDSKEVTTFGYCTDTNAVNPIRSGILGLGGGYVMVSPWKLNAKCVPAVVISGYTLYTVDLSDLGSSMQAYVMKRLVIPWVKTTRTDQWLGEDVLSCFPVSHQKIVNTVIRFIADSEQNYQSFALDMETIRGFDHG